MSQSGNQAVVETQEAFDAQWNLDDIPACDLGMMLLKRFADTDPISFRVLAQHSFYDDGNDPLLAASPEWAAFTGHYTDCENCNEI